MIFLSYTHTDKPKVDPIAQQLAKVFGQDKVFYDGWSIQPGEGIIEKMNEGLAECEFFFFFVSHESVNSEMVKLEWQNAVYQSAGEDTQIIPVRIDDCSVPPIIQQLRYIDYFGQGQEVALRQMIDVISRQNVYEAGNTIAQSNVCAYLTQMSNGIRAEIRAENYMEPRSVYYFLVPATAENIRSSLKSGKFGSQGISRRAVFKPFGQVNSMEVNAIRHSRPTPTSPGFPFVVELTTTDGALFPLVGIARSVSDEEVEQVPMKSKEHDLLREIRSLIGQ